MRRLAAVALSYGLLKPMAPNRHLDQRLKLHHFRAVDAIEAHGSLLKAAAALSVTQPALSKSLHEAEDLLQVKLFDRHPRGVKPTSAGSAVVDVARRVLAQLRRLDETSTRFRARAAEPSPSACCR